MAANPLLYQKVRHRRSRTPRSFGNYRLFKRDLQAEFGAQCVYCRALDRVKGYETFGVDHYRPKTLYPRLALEYLNLFYACNKCNSLKRDFWPTGPQRKEGVFIPNPCEHIMFDHLRYHVGTVVNASRAGEFTIEQLDLNDPDVIEFRTSFVKTLAFIAAQMDASKATIAEAKKASAKARTAAHRKIADDVATQAQSNVTEYEKLLSGLIG
jgi:uncharacterized protein (TIGR02646 family)